MLGPLGAAGTEAGHIGVSIVFSWRPFPCLILAARCCCTILMANDGSALTRGPSPQHGRCLAVIFITQIDEAIDRRRLKI